MNPVSGLVTALLAAAGTAGPDAFAVGIVESISPGLAKDGNAAVTVTWNGATTYAAYGAHYTPVLGHVVLMARTQPMTILMQIVGTPPT